MPNEQVSEIYDFVAEMLFELRDQSMVDEMLVLRLLGEFQAFLALRGGDLGGSDEKEDQEKHGTMLKMR